MKLSVLRCIKSIIILCFLLNRFFLGLISKNVVLIAQGGRDTVIRSVRRSEGNLF